MAKKVNKNNTEIDSSVGGILAKLWKLIIFDGNLHRLLKFYLDKYKLRGGTRSKSTINGYFTAESMTWKTFMFLIFDILPVKKMRITIELTMVNNDVIPHTVSITSDDWLNMADEEKEIFDTIYEKDKKDISKGNINDRKKKKSNR